MNRRWRMKEQIFNENELTKLYKDNYTRFMSIYNLNTFLDWCWEWIDTCNKINRISCEVKRKR